MNKKQYIIPAFELINYELDSIILDLSKTNSDTKPVAPDNNNNYGEGLGGSTGSETVPGEAKHGWFNWDDEI